MNSIPGRQTGKRIKTSQVQIAGAVGKLQAVRNGVSAEQGCEEGGDGGIPRTGGAGYGVNIKCGTPDFSAAPGFNVRWSCPAQILKNTVPQADRPQSKLHVACWENTDPASALHSWEPSRKIPNQKLLNRKILISS